MTNCLLSGYYQDGVPVYGLCKDSTGTVSWKTNNEIPINAITKITANAKGIKDIPLPKKIQVMTSCYECTGTCTSSVTVIH